MEFKEDVLYIYTDGASRGNPGPASYGFVLVFEDEGVVQEENGFIGKTTNNRAEYRAVINALETATDFHSGEVVVYSDSQLLVRQLQGKWRVKSEELRELFELVKERIQEFDDVEFRHVPRENRYVSMADRLCNDKLDSEGY